MFFPLFSLLSVLLSLHPSASTVHCYHDCALAGDESRSVLGELIWVTGDYDECVRDLDRLEAYYGEGEKNEYIR